MTDSDTSALPADSGVMPEEKSKILNEKSTVGGLTLEGLLKAGAHFGHKVSRWNPKMSPYIFTVRNRFHIINLEETLSALNRARAFVQEVVKSGGTVLFVGTKRQARPIVRQQAQACGMPFVVTRWLGGTMTNFKTIQRSIRKIGQIEETLGGSGIANYTKKERLMMERELKKSNVLFEGIRSLKKLPEVIFVVDTNADKIAVREARQMGVKVIAVVDTNSDPTGIDYPIPANDDAITTLALITQSISAAIKHVRPAVQAPPSSGETA